MKMIVLVLAGALIILFFVRYVERVSIFFPQKDMDLGPAQQGLAREDVYFKSGGRFLLHGWFFKNPSARTTLLFFHGNAGNISHRLDKIALFYQLGLNIFIVDYRGYGKSEGIPSEEGLYEDALAAFDHLNKRPDIDKGRIIGYGESLGGTVVIDLALKRPLAALILDSCFSSAADMAAQHYPFLPAFLLKTKMDSMNKVKDIRAPKLFIHSPDDEIVPWALAQKLYSAAQAPKTFLEIRGDHNGGYADSGDTYTAGIRDFLNAQGW